MSALLSLGFAAPAALLALLALPALLWLLRLTPPRPKTVDFPPTALMRDLVDREETPAHTPWWLVALRIGVVGLLALALAHPFLGPGPTDDGRDGPLWLVLDDGWPSAPRWEETLAEVTNRLDAAEARGRPVVLAATASGADHVFAPRAVSDVRRDLAVLAPRPWAEDRAGLIEALAKSAETAPPGSVVWISHGSDLAADDATRRFAADLARIAKGAPVTLSLPDRVDTVAVERLENGADGLRVGLLRTDAGAADRGRLAAFDRRGRGLAEADYAFAAGETRAELKFALPLDLANDVARVEILDRRSAGGVRLVDDRWRRRAVGLVSGAGFERDQPLLAPTHYLQAALASFADVRKPRAAETDAAIRELIGAGVSVITLADVGTLPPETASALLGWVEGGGVLLRFAGPKLAGLAPDDPLVPVALRRSERALGGALSWSSPRGLGPFAETGPFVDLAAPKDVRVTRQILAEPGPDLAARTWASLDDGTPLVTAAARGRGRVVLFHVGADTAWSDLPLSGVFPEMLARVVALAGLSREPGPEARTSEALRPTTLPPWRLLDGFGRLGAPNAEARPVDVAAIATIAPDRRHPPGLWGRDDRLAALQTLPKGATLAPLAPRLDALSPTIAIRGGAVATPLAPGLLLAAIALALIDGLVVLVPALGLRLPRRATTTAALAALALAGFVALAPDPARAEGQAVPEVTRDAALSPRLAWVATGDASVDDITRRGLEALSRTLADRTSFEPAEPVAVDPARDDLSVLALIYWPVTPGAAAIAPSTLARVDAFMRGGGTVVFDTRDADEADALGAGRTTAAGAALRRMLAGLDLPELEPVPADHVLGRTFYLLQGFPGRFDGRVWVEATNRDETRTPEGRAVRTGDGVSPILVTGNDLAGAWAQGDDGSPLLPMATPDRRGREMALRTGVNLVMYVLTGNYKADQVHVPALLERLGR